MVSPLVLLALPLMTPAGGGASTAGETELLASAGVPDERFGTSVDVSGDTAVVGAPYRDDATHIWVGAAYVFRRSGSLWVEEAQFLPAVSLDQLRFGDAVAVQGDTVAVGAPGEDVGGVAKRGSVTVYVRQGSTWIEQAKVLGPPTHIAQFGESVALEGERLLVGAPRAGSGFGSGFVYLRTGTTWGLEAVLTDPGATQHSVAQSVALSGDTAVLGAHRDTPAQFFEQMGAAHVFVRSGTTWTYQAKLTASDGLAYDNFGWSVDVSGDDAVISAVQDNHEPGVGGNQAGEGSAYVFTRSGTTWTEVAKLTAWDVDGSDRYSESVAISGDRVVVGSPQDNHSTKSNAGSAYSFVRTGTTWGLEAKLAQSTPELNSFFGHAVSLDGDLLAAGAPLHGNVHGQFAGTTYLLRFPVLPPPNYCTAGTTTNGCNARITASGTPSVTLPSGFVVTVSGVEGQRQGLIYFGTNGKKATPWGGGPSYQCVRAPFRRTSHQSSGGTAGQCDGTFALDFNAWMASHPWSAPGPAQTTWMQAWFRDPPAPKTTAFSDAMSFQVCP